MGYTVTEKILGAKCSRPVRPGQLIELEVDFAFASDITGHLAVSQFEAMEVERVHDPARAALVLDHATPSKDAEAAAICRRLRAFARRQGMVLYGEGAGVEHVVLHEDHHVRPGSVVFGADSHTTTLGACAAFATGVGSTDLAAIWALGRTWVRVPGQVRVEFTGQLSPWVGAKDLILHLLGRLGTSGALYRSLEFGGPVVRAMDMDGRFTLCNMAVEAGAKNGLVEADATTAAYFGLPPDSHRLRDLTSDADAEYEAVLSVDVTGLPPQVALPFSPGKVRGIDQIEPTAINRAFIGSCTNGRLGDLRTAARVLARRRVHPEVTLVVLPGSVAVYRAALAEGLIEGFLAAGAVVGPPSCGACYGGHLGAAGAGDVVVSTSNRNFRGRMGHPEARVYLASPAVAAAAAVAGRIAAPGEVV